MTTSFEREILTHFANGGTSTTWSPSRCNLIYHECVKKFSDAGILRYDSGSDEIVGVQAALKVYMTALAAVPLPVKMQIISWQIP